MMNWIPSLQSSNDTNTEKEELLSDIESKEEDGYESPQTIDTDFELDSDFC